MIDLSALQCNIVRQEVWKSWLTWSPRGQCSTQAMDMKKGPAAISVLEEASFGVLTRPLPSLCLCQLALGGGVSCTMCVPILGILRACEERVLLCGCRHERAASFCSPNPQLLLSTLGDCRPRGETNCHLLWFPQSGPSPVG